MAITRQVWAAVGVLFEYQVTGMISYRIKDKQELLHGPIGNDMQSSFDLGKRMVFLSIRRMLPF